MFHQGDLQSGISRAITEQKLVACFIRSDNDESQKWEQHWLGIGRRPAPIDVFALKAIILRIEYGSQEMGFLNAFCPVTSSPAFVVIDKGQVLEKIESGVSQEEFTSRVSAALDLDMSIVNKADWEKAKTASQSQSEGQTQPESSSTQAAAGTVARGEISVEQSASGRSAPQPTHQSTPTNTSTNPQSPLSSMQSLFPNRAQQHEEEKLKRDAAEKAERTARATARRKEAEAAAAAAATASPTDKGKGKANNLSEQEKSRRDWLSQQKQRKDEAKKERERILAQIEADKAERKARSQRDKAETTGPSESLLRPSADAASRRRSGPGSMCSLQIRLFDGTSIKGRFEPSATLGGKVRDWIKTTTAEQGNIEAADIPFTFKQIMAPQPSRNIEISEEHQSLLELGLAPTATLVLAPVAGYTDAYNSNAGRGYMSSALHYTYSAVNTTTSLLGAALSYVPGFGPAQSSTPTSSQRPSNTSSEDSESSMSNYDGGSDAPASSSRIKVKTLADQRAEEARRKDQNAEFYNGNSSAFEGRKDDDDDVDADRKD